MSGVRVPHRPPSCNPVRDNAVLCGVFLYFGIRVIAVRVPAGRKVATFLATFFLHCLFEVFIQGDEKKSRHHRSVNASVERLHSGITVNPGTRQYVQLHRSANRTVLIRTLP